MMLGRHAQSVVPFGIFVVAAGMMTVHRVQLYHRTGARYQVPGNIPHSIWGLC
jgi:hypothetical protein